MTASQAGDSAAATAEDSGRDGQEEEVFSPEYRAEAREEDGVTPRDATHTYT